MAKVFLEEKFDLKYELDISSKAVDEKYGVDLCYVSGYVNGDFNISIRGHACWWGPADGRPKICRLDNYAHQITSRKRDTGLIWKWEGAHKSRGRGKFLMPKEDAVGNWGFAKGPKFHLEYTYNSDCTDLAQIIIIWTLPIYEQIKEEVLRDPRLFKFNHGRIFNKKNDEGDSWGLPNFDLKDALIYSKIPIQEN